jgi:PAS domain S-box-containing protein
MVTAVSTAGQAIRHIAFPRMDPWESLTLTVTVLGLVAALTAHRSRLKQLVLLQQAELEAAERQRADVERISLARALGQAAEGVVITDAGGVIRYVNAGFSKMTGYSAEEAIGQNPRFLKSGSQDPTFYADMWRTISAGEIWRGEVVNRRKDGSVYTEEMTITPVRDSRGATTNYIAIKQDVTDRRAAEESRRFLASIVESTSDAVIGRTPDGLILSWNRGAERLYGYSASEVLGKPMSMLVAPEKHSELQDVGDRLKLGERFYQLEGLGLTKDGRKIDILITASAIRNAKGTLESVASIIRDITARKQAEAAKALLASIVESAHLAIFSNAADGTFLSWNKAAEAVFGYIAEEILGKSISILAPPGGAVETSQVLDRVKRGETISQFETVAARRDGKLIDVSLTISAIRDASGKVVGASTIGRDISDRKRADEERKLLASIVESSDDAIITSSLDGAVTSWNKGAEALYGYRAGEVLGKPVSFLARPGETAQIVRRVSRGERLSHLERTRLRKDGTSVPVSLTVFPIWSASGEVVAVGAIARDLSERRRNEEALRRSEDKYRSLVANIPDVIWTADSEGHPVFVSRNSERLSGYTPEEICRPGAWFSRIHPEDRQKMSEAYKALLANGQAYSVEYRLQKKDGQWIWIHDRAATSYEKDGRRYADGLVSDITERKRALELIEWLQRRTEMILESAGEGIVGLDLAGKFTFVNGAAARMLGYPRSELIGREMHTLVRHSHADGTACAPDECVVAAAIREGKEGRVHNVIFHNRDGRGFPVEFVSTPKVEDGRVDGAVVVFRDVTEAKFAQERIEVSLKEKEALLREIHHRVKNNLQVVCSLLRLQSRGVEDPDAKRVFEGTRHRVKAMALVHETLYQSGDLAGIDFSVYVSRLAGQLMHSYGLTPRSVRVQIDVESVVLPIDVAIPCALILTELISNSLKHAFAGGHGGEMRVAFQRSAESSWLLEVSNSGEAPQAPESKPRQGSSFGLELVRLLTEQLNGTMRIERTPGFCVGVVFPAAGSPEEK